jgi:hypothetical protein
MALLAMALCVVACAAPLATTDDLAAVLKELRAESWLEALEAADVRTATDLALLDSADLAEVGLPVGTRARIAAWRDDGGGRTGADGGAAQHRRGLQAAAAATPRTDQEWELAMRESILSDYDPAVPGAYPTRVSLGLNIFKVTQLDLSTHHFELSAWIRASWTDPRLDWTSNPVRNHRLFCTFLYNKTGHLPR